jgi:cobaltochelatase CobT
MMHNRKRLVLFDSITSTDIQSAWQRTYAGMSLQDDNKLDPIHNSIPHKNKGTLSTVIRRSRADSAAAWQYWHRVDDRPVLHEAQFRWYLLLEQARVEELASRDLAGMALNLSMLEALTPRGMQPARVYQLARKLFTEAVGQERHVIELRGFALEASGEATDYVDVPGSSDQGWLSRIRRRTTQRPCAPPSEAEIHKALVNASIHLRDSRLFSSALLPLIRDLAQATLQPAMGEFYSDDHIPIVQSPEPCHPQAAEDKTCDQTQLCTKDSVESKQNNETNAVCESAAEPGFQGRTVAGDALYCVYSTQWDEEFTAEHFFTSEDREALLNFAPVDQSKMRILALRLQRRLLTARLRFWQYDQECGLLDRRRLAKLLIPGGATRVFRKEEDLTIPEACVTLLVDQSGSMRGHPQLMVAQAIDFAVQTLEACQIACEVLGFTTTHGRVNPVTDAWRIESQPVNPGRLNAIRHIIYKSAHQPWRHVRHNLGLLLREGFGHENIDGEALAWAARRLAFRPESRKILLVLSDAAPYDAATAEVNGRSYLESHLREVIAKIEASPIHLVGIGTSHSVGYYYRCALILKQTESIADTLFNKLGQLLTMPDNPKKGRSL